MCKTNFFSKAVAIAMMLLGLTFVSCDKIDNPLPSAWDGVTPNLPLTLEAVNDGATMNVTFVSTLPKVTTIQYSTDGGQSWKFFTISGGKPFYRYGGDPDDYTTWSTQGERPARRTISGVHQILIKAENESYGSSESGDLADYREGNIRNLNISVDADCYIYGNIMSLVGGEQFSTKTDLSGKYNFQGLFSGNAKLKSHPSKQLLLPATTLTENCYTSLFKGCTALTAAPALPATTLAEYCYNSMFIDCTALTAAPALPATTLAEGCYGSMFGGCTALTAAPALPATTLAEGCYAGMFGGCTALTAAPELPVTELANYCYNSMFSSCTALTTAPELPATELANYCYAYMFNACTALTKAPVLPATTLAEGCYAGMFSSCTNLNYIKCLATSIADGAGGFTAGWTMGVSATGTFVCADKTEYGAGKFWDPTLTWAWNKAEAPAGWTAKNPDEE